MIAPPRPPADPEALIPEARERQRRRRLVAATSVASVAGLVLLVHALLAGPGPTGTAAGSGGASTPNCRPSQLSVSAFAQSMGAGPLEVQYRLVNRSGGSCALPTGMPAVAFALNGETVRTTQRLFPPPYAGFGQRAGRVLEPGRKVHYYYLVVFGDQCNPERVPARGTATVSLRFNDGLSLSARETTPENSGFPLVPACSGRNISVSPLLRYS